MRKDVKDRKNTGKKWNAPMYEVYNRISQMFPCKDAGKSSPGNCIARDRGAVLSQQKDFFLKLHFI